MDYTNLNVLVVEDSPLQRAHLVDLLCLLQAKSVQQAPDGRDALRLLLQSEKLPDIIFCDLDMPGMDGIELIRAIGDAKLAVSISVVSSMDIGVLHTVERMSRALGLTFLGALPKPVDLKQLEHLLTHYSSANMNLEQGSSEAVSIQRDELENALERQEYVVHYQPKVNTCSGLLRGVEALIRWKSPARGLVPPGQFIPLLLRFNLIDAVTMNVIEDTVQALKGWKEQGLKLTASVNLSAESLADMPWIDKITALTKAADVANEQLIFEITESEIIRDPGKALGTLARLRMKGFGLAIDDYGTGYSSMQQLSVIPFTELKLDRSLVHGIATDEGLRVIVASALEMSRRLGLSTVAEGIEEEDDWRVIAELKCEMLQGFVVAKPMPEAEVIPWWTSAAPALREQVKRINTRPKG